MGSPYGAERTYWMILCYQAVGPLGHRGICRMMLDYQDVETQDTKLRLKDGLSYQGKREARSSQCEARLFLLATRNS
jgi:hypothetical protein